MPIRFHRKLLFLITLFSVLVSKSGKAFSQSVQAKEVYDLYMDFVHATSYQSKLENSKKFSDGLQQALLNDPKATLSFDSLQKYKVMIVSSDKLVRMFTWEIEAGDGTYTYYGWIQSYNKRQKKYEIYKLNDKSADMRNPENATLDNTRWFGAYYYQIVSVKYRRKKYYILLGWNAHNRITNKRLIDVLYFTNGGFPKFGKSIFYTEKGRINKRILFEFRAGLFMTLRYNEKKNAIVFDHLSPSNPNLEGVYAYYGPDFTYDMLQFKDGKWKYVKNIIPHNNKTNTDKIYNTPK